MSAITEKFCEECGKNSPIAVQYCKFCGAKFPKIDHPEYIQANFPQQHIGSPQQKVPSHHEIPPQYIQPQQQNIPPPGFGVQPASPPRDQSIVTTKPPRMWDGGGLTTAIKQLYTNPSESAAPLLEDPQAPSSFILILFVGISASLVTYFTTIKTIFTEIIDDDDGTLKSFTSSDGIRNLAINGAVMSFIVVFLSWWVLSWLLGRWLKGGLPKDQYLHNAPSKSMRQFVGFLSVPTIIRNFINIILLQLESSRDAKISVTQYYGVSGPDIEYLTTFSGEYQLISFIISILAALITSSIFYRSTKNGLKHRGISPFIIAFLIALVPLITIY